jgi:hypothetical protein
VFEKLFGAIGMIKNFNQIANPADLPVRLFDILLVRPVGG